MSGKKLPLTPNQCRQIDQALNERLLFRDIALFRLSISTMAQPGWLLNLRVKAIVHDNWNVVDSIYRPNGPYNSKSLFVSQSAQLAVRDLIEAQELDLHHYLFSARSCPVKPISQRYFSKRLKEWVSMVGLNAADYGLHSLRRTGATHILDSSGDVVAVSRLLGHGSHLQTKEYLKVNKDKHVELARKYSIL